MAAVHPIEVLEKRLRDLLEAYESELGDAVDRVTEKVLGKNRTTRRNVRCTRTRNQPPVLPNHPPTKKLARSLRPRLSPQVAGRGVGIMTTKNLKESLKEARKDASRQVLAQIAAVIAITPGSELQADCRALRLRHGAGLSGGKGSRVEPSAWRGIASVQESDKVGQTGAFGEKRG